MRTLMVFGLALVACSPAPTPENPQPDPIASAVVSAASAEPSAQSSALPVPTMSAPTPVPTPTYPEPNPAKPTQEMVACNLGLKKLMESYWKGVSSRTSIQSTRLLLKGFGEACAKALPALAGAAVEASRVGRAERSRILGKASAEYCAKAETLETAAQLLIDCPKKDASSAMHDKLDAGTYAFAKLIVEKGVAADMTYSQELMLQASLNPKLDK